MVKERVESEKWVESEKNRLLLVENRVRIVMLLKSIAKPSGAYRINRVEYMQNVISASVSSAREALLLLGEDVSDIIIPPQVVD
jgi:hypothetical protein